MAKRRKPRSRLRRRAEPAPTTPRLRSVGRRPRAAARTPSLSLGARSVVLGTEEDGVVEIDGVKARLDLHFDLEAAPKEMVFVFLGALMSAFNAAVGEGDSKAFPLHVIVSGWNGVDLCGTIEPV